MKLITLFIPAMTLAACTQADSTAYFIAPVYDDHVTFSVTSMHRDNLKVIGKVEGWADRNTVTRETYFQRFVEKNGRFRKIHAIGAAIESTTTVRGDTTVSRPFDQYVEFDELGIFNGEPVDPISLIPLYPGHRVRKNEEWHPDVPVSIELGDGLAHFTFVIDSVFSDANKYTLVRINVKFEGTLAPAKSLGNASVSIKGGGWYVWNCTINQRRDTHLNAEYRADLGANKVIQSIQSSDSLIIYTERWKF